MPKMDGIILTKEISTKYPELPVMVMTAFDEEYSAAMAISVGAREFIRKPFSLDEFAIRLHKMIVDSKTLKGMKRGKEVDEEIQKIRNELETLERIKGEREVDEDVQKLLDELEALNRKKSENEIDEDAQEPVDDLEEILKKS